jgi:thymidylate synthase (FAD)
MKIIKPSVEFVTPVNEEEILKKLELAGRTCYKSEGKIEDGSAEKFIKGIIKRGHEAVLEHGSFTLRFICDRGVTHEVVRHRIAAYCQESTRYCSYDQDKFGNEITVILPCYFDTGMGTMSNSLVYDEWKIACERAERSYFKLLEMGATPQEARAVLPNSLKTELVMTADIREWRHFFKLRCAPAAHPQMREVAIMALDMCKEAMPTLFEDIDY